MKKLLLSLLCLGMLVGCNSTPTLESDFKDYQTALNEANKIVNNYETLGSKLEYTEMTSGSEVNANFKNGKCDIKITFNKDDQQFISITLTDNGISGNNYSSDYTNTLENTLDLDVFEMNVNSRNDIVSFFNNNKKTTDNINGYVLSRDLDTFTIKNKTEQSLSDAIPITIDQIELINKKCYKDSIDTYWMEAKFKNNSDKTITYINYEYEVDGETNYLTSSNTLKPGKTSTKAETFGPKSKKFDDAKLLKADITYKKDNGDDGYIEYDAELEEYSWY